MIKDILLFGFIIFENAQLYANACKLIACGIREESLEGRNTRKHATMRLTKYQIQK